MDDFVAEEGMQWWIVEEGDAPVLEAMYDSPRSFGARDMLVAADGKTPEALILGDKDASDAPWRRRCPDHRPAVNFELFDSSVGLWQVRERTLVCISGCYASYFLRDAHGVVATDLDEQLLEAFVASSLDWLPEEHPEVCREPYASQIADLIREGCEGVDLLKGRLELDEIVHTALRRLIPPLLT
ncbi:MAG: hypothetical protein RLY93_06575 [Sumerlaeia bacterium]